MTYRNGDAYVKPNVSYCEGNKEVYYNYPPPIIYGYVDLGLPSGTKWATQNVGASKPSDAGLYFQWGDTVGYTADQIGVGEGQKAFTWKDYKWNPSGDGNTFTKYTTTGVTLELEDDAAHVNMGGSWHMPTPKQINELIVNTTTAWTTSDNVSGVTFTSSNGKSIFIPAAGNATNGSFGSIGITGYVWSSVLHTSYIDSARDLYFYSRTTELNGGSRFSGFSVRGVIG